MNQYGFVRVTAASAKTVVAHSEANAQAMIEVLNALPGSDVILFPELGITGYTCGDLFGQSKLLEAGVEALGQVVSATRGKAQLVVAGLPVAVRNSLFNCGVAIADGKILGVVPKQFIPNYKEYYESRWFSSANGTEPRVIELAGEEVPFGIDLLFEGPGGLLVGIEVCEDLWMPIPPTSVQAVAGANLLLNLSASNETIGKSRYRTDLVVGQSGRCIAAYAYASAGPSESTTDLVFGGHCLIAENGALLGSSPRVGDGATLQRGSVWVTRDIDLEKLQADRRLTTSFDDCRKYLSPFRKIPFQLASELQGLEREVSGTPFVPKAGGELHDRCAEIVGIQCAALAKRLEQLPQGTTLNLGISGGLDSTLALLIAVKTCDMLGITRKTIHGITMPGFGTTGRTLANALGLMDQLGISSETIDITELSLRSFVTLGHAPFGIDCANLDVETFKQRLAEVPHNLRHDLIFENVQARLRTFLLMSRGFVIGTGDLSEQALGWSTYNGDHMSMYNPNASIPKTLVTFLVRYLALNEFDAGAVRDHLLSVVETPISPELLPPGAQGEILQSTEEILGPYELIDFILYNTIRCGYPPKKIRYLAEHADFSKSYTKQQIDQTLRTFFKRFFSQQYKRSCVPDGPKVGSVSLSPRGDWRMPSDADPAAWLEGLEPG